MSWLALSLLLAPTPSDWPTAAPDEHGLDGERLAGWMASLRADNPGNLHAVLVVRDGVLVHEAYLEGPDENWGQPLGQVTFDEDRLHDLRSVTKSVTSALVGMALRKRRGHAVDRPLLDLLDVEPAAEARAKRRIELEHALTMTAGLAWDESMSYASGENSEIRMIRSPDPVQYVLDQPVAHPPGEHFEYSGGMTQLLAAVVEEQAGRSLDAFAERELFRPLGIRRFEWHEHGDGSSSAASGLRLRPRDLAKFGWLFLNEGRWGKRQVVPAEWVAASLEARVDAYPARSYGYQWWVGHYQRGDERMDVPTAMGNGGQRIFLIERLGLLVVVAAGRYNLPTPASDALLVEQVLPAAGEEGWTLTGRRR